MQCTYYHRPVDSFIYYVTRKTYNLCINSYNFNSLMSYENMLVNVLTLSDLLCHNKNQAMQLIILTTLIGRQNSEYVERNKMQYS